MRELNDRGPLRVCLLGASLEVANLGVRALAGSLIGLIEETCPGARITMMYGNQGGGGRRKVLIGERPVEVDVVHFRLSPKARLREHLLWILLLGLVYRAVPVEALRGWILKRNLWLRTLAEADLVGDIDGGDSLSDIYGLRRFLPGVLPVLTAILVGQRPVLLPQTYGPYRSWIARGLARLILRGAGAIYTRDRQSFKVVLDLLGRRAATKTISFCPDVAFTLAAGAPKAGAAPSAAGWIEPPLEGRGERPLIGLNVSGLLYAGGYSGDNMFGLRSDYKSLVGALLRGLLAGTQARILLVPHLFGSGGESDESACRTVLESLSAGERERVSWVAGPCDEREIKGLIGQCDFFIGSRMHACIAAISQGIPSVGLAYSHKFAGVFESAGVGHMVLDARQATQAELIERCLERYGEREAIAAQLKDRLPVIQTKIRVVFQEMLGGRTQPQSVAERWAGQGSKHVAAEH